MVRGYHLRDYGWTPLNQNPAQICDDTLCTSRVGRQRYGPGNGSRIKPQSKVFAVPSTSRGGGLNDIHPMRRGGVKSFVDDLVLGRGVVISRAATSLRSVETQPLTRRFVRIRRATISIRGQGPSQHFAKQRPGKTRTDCVFDWQFLAFFIDRTETTSDYKISN